MDVTTNLASDADAEQESGWLTATGAVDAANTFHRATAVSFALQSTPHPLRIHSASTPHPPPHPPPSDPNHRATLPQRPSSRTLVPPGGLWSPSGALPPVIHLNRFLAPSPASEFPPLPAPGGVLGWSFQPPGSDPRNLLRSDNRPWIGRARIRGVGIVGGAIHPRIHPRIHP